MFSNQHNTSKIHSCNYLHIHNSIIVIIILLIFNNLEATAQQSDQQRSHSDTGKILFNIDKAVQLIDNSPNDALLLLKKSLNESEKINYNKGIAIANLKLGKWYFGSDNSLSIQYGLKALSAFENNSWGSIEDIAETHLLLAESYDEKGQTDSSAYFYYLLGAEMESGNINDPEFAVTVFTKLTIFWVNLDFGTVTNKEYQKTIQRFLEKANSAARKIKDKEDGESIVYFIQGAYFHGIKEFDSARYFYQKYITKRERLKKLKVPRKISTLFNIADTYLQQNKPNEAMIYINAIKEIGKDPEKVKYLAFYITFIDFLTGKALYQQKQYTASVKLLEQTHEEIKKTGVHFRNEIVESYKISADCYEALGNYKKALEQKNIYIQLYDSLTKKDRIDMISRLEVRYGIAEKDKELALQKLTISEVNNSNRNKNLWIAGMTIFTVLGFVIFSLWRNRLTAKQKLQEQKISNLQQKMKIEKLHASIAGEQKERKRMARELHDGIGGLLSVAKMNFEISKNKINTIPSDFNDGIKMLEEASSELRQAAQNLMPEVLIQEGLSFAIDSFCERMSSKGSIKFTYQSFGQQNKIGQMSDLNIYRIVQELIHNIVKHAKASKALVQLNFNTDESISIAIEDDGIGLPPESDMKQNGMGIKNIRDRVNELNGKMDIQTAPGKGTAIYLEFQAENQDEI